MALPCSVKSLWATIELGLAWLKRLLRRLLYLLLWSGPIPQHVAFIMDGNRRYAEQCRMDRMGGHLQGYKKMVDVIQWCLEMGVTCITVYAFSIDNYKRSREEVDNLMLLAADKFKELLTCKEAAEWKAELRTIGDLSLAPEHVHHAAARLTLDSLRLGNNQAVVNICFSYTATQELGHALSCTRQGLAAAQLLPSDVDAALLTRCMHTRECPPVDLLVRTSGEHRLSDFMLWQSSCAQLQFVPRLWPDLSFMDLVRCVMDYQRAVPDLQCMQAQLRNCNTGSYDSQFAICMCLQQRLADAQLITWAAAACRRPPGNPASCCALADHQEQQHDMEVTLQPALSALSSISEDEPANCPHPSARLRVEGFLRCLQEQQEQWLNKHAVMAD